MIDPEPDNGAARPVINMEGERLALGPVREDLLPLGAAFWDVVYMDILAEDFQSSVLSRIFVPDPER